MHVLYYLRHFGPFFLHLPVPFDEVYNNYCNFVIGTPPRLFTKFFSLMQYRLLSSKALGLARKLALTVSFRIDDI